ncbi:MAG: hypothetical protein RI556_13130, partial [Hydrogenovibrio sp.]|uniref:hypothetical protein n=1 Tax=Hydrogenovibrio sp. TaxID=2065821 RepID=UPI00287006F3
NPLCDRVAEGGDLKEAFDTAQNDYNNAVSTTNSRYDTALQAAKDHPVVTGTDEDGNEETARCEDVSSCLLTPQLIFPDGYVDYIFGDVREFHDHYTPDNEDEITIIENTFLDAYLVKRPSCLAAREKYDALDEEIGDIEDQIQSVRDQCEDSPEDGGQGGTWNDTTNTCEGAVANTPPEISFDQGGITLLEKIDQRGVYRYAAP